MPRANKEYECFECKSIITKRQEYKREIRYEWYRIIRQSYWALFKWESS